MTNKAISLLRTNDDFHYDTEVITEASLTGANDRKKLFLKGIVQKADVLNQNGRIYPRNLLEREIRNYQKFIIENRALGELDHPEASVVELKNVSHVMREVKMDDDGVVWGRLEVLNTPSGLILQSLVESKIKIGISSRGVGSVTKEGDYYKVGTDFQLICWDIVSEPSTTSAFVIPEGKQLTESELRKVFNKTDRINRLVNEIMGNS